MKAVHVIAWILLVIGGLNWLLVGIDPTWDVVAMIFGAGSVGARIVYILVGLSAIIALFTHKKDCKTCDSRGAQPAM
jgi:uncharacterized membrane protein YuzA (DUF378 family)